MPCARRQLLTAWMFCLLVSGTAVAGTSEWPQMRGPSGDGQVTGTELFAGEEAGLSLAWRIPLGLGYSGIAVADGHAVTLFSDGTHDVAMAVDAATGQELWRYSFADTYKPHDGADGGPLSTPVIHKGVVYGLGATGELFALRLSSGEEVWTRNMGQDLGAREPEYGFTTSPLVAGKVLVLQTGGSEGRSISGLSAATGETLWTMGDGKVEYQSPALLEIGGRTQVVSVSEGAIQGIDPEKGTLLWEHALGEKDDVNSANLMPVGENAFLTFINGEATLFKAQPGEDGTTLEEIYRTRSLGGTYAMPVYHQGHLYGFSRQFLSCINAESGELVWKSRPPGGRGLILVDGYLVIYAAQGNVVIAKASPDGYQETARLQALEGSGYTWPSLAGDKIYVRNLREMAAVTITQAPVGALARADNAVPVGAGTAFAAFVAQVEAAEDRQALVDGFLTQHPEFPVVEGNFIHFVYHGEVDDLAIVGNMLPGGAAQEMTRVADTALYYRTLKVEPGTRWEYGFMVNFDEQVADPRNGNTVPATSGPVEWSVVSLAGVTSSPYIAEPAAGRPRGTVQELTFKSSGQKTEREIKVYLPAGYGEGDARYPLLVVHGLDWLEKGLLANTLDNLIGDQVDPVVVAVVSPSPQWWMEAGGSGTTEYVDLLAGEIVPFLGEQFRLQDKASARAVMGSSYFGFTSLYAALKHPQVFGKVAAQSTNTGLGADEEMMSLIRAGKGRELQIYLGWSRYENHDVDSGDHVRDENLQLVQALEESGASIFGGEILDAYGWASWRDRTDDILVGLFPAP